MSNHVNRTLFTIFFILIVCFFLAIALAISYFLCHIDPEIESGWLRGFWHGSNLGPNFILSNFDGRLLKAPLHSPAYSVFWWVFGIWTCLVWCYVIWRWISKILKGPSDSYI